MSDLFTDAQVQEIRRIVTETLASIGDMIPHKRIERHPMLTHW